MLLKRYSRMKSFDKNTTQISGLLISLMIFFTVCRNSGDWNSLASPSFCLLYIYKKRHFPLCAAVFSSLLILSLHPLLPVCSDVHLTRIIENDSCNWLVTSSTELLLHCAGSLFLEETELSNKRQKVSYGVKLDIPMAGPHFQKVLLILPASGHYTAPISPESHSF